MKSFKKFKSGAGFTMIDLLVSAIIIAIIFSFVLANFRTGKFSGQLDIVLKQVINGITTVRTMSLGGQVIDDEVPAGGYGIHLENNQYYLFAALMAEDEELSDSLRQFDSIELEFCSLDEGEPSETNLPCGGSWSEVNSPLEITFSLSDIISSNIEGANYVGGVIEHQRTNQRAYFYVSLTSGLVTGDLL